MLQSNNSLKTKILAATKILMNEFPLTSTLTPIPPRFRASLLFSFLSHIPHCKANNTNPSLIPKLFHLLAARVGLCVFDCGSFHSPKSNTHNPTPKPDQNETEPSYNRGSTGSLSSANTPNTHWWIFLNGSFC